MSEKKDSYFIRVKSDGKTYRAGESSLTLVLGDEVLFERDQFQDIGVIACDCPNIEESEGDQATIIRKLTDKDREEIEVKKTEAQNFLEKCAEKIEKHGLSMELLEAELSYDGKKLTFYFTAPGRIDFRSLVPDLAATFKKLIRLQQVGSRDRVKCIACAGRCGRETCCRSFLRGDLDNVTVDMASDQGLSLMGSNRVTGLCGKLQCCLRFEDDDYRKAKAKMPAPGSKIKTPEGMGIVISQNIIKNKVRVELDKDKRILEVDC